MDGDSTTTTEPEAARTHSVKTLLRCGSCSVMPSYILIEKCSVSERDQQIVCEFAKTFQFATLKESRDEVCQMYLVCVRCHLHASACGVEDASELT